jgi:predicted GTPase
MMGGTLGAGASRSNGDGRTVSERRVVIIGAAGRDFHNFNVVYRGNPRVRVVAFTAAQIPGIDDRRYPPELAGPGYTEGIPIRPEDELEEIIRRERVDEVVFSYSDVAHEHVMHQASRALAAGADFTLLGPQSTMIGADVPVISVCAVRTGAGKSQTTRFVADLLLSQGLRPVIIRHPMPYGDLLAQRVQRFATADDLVRANATIEEREEYEGHLARGLVVYAGVDYRAIVQQAQAEADIILWDGGNNDFPFVRSDLEIVVVDPLRPGHEVRFHPGETNARRADILVVNKVNSAPVENVTQVVETVRALNPTAALVQASSAISVALPDEVRGRRVLVVEVGPTLTHGGMATGAGFEAARLFGAAEIIDPGPYAVGGLVTVLAGWPHLGPILPAVGYYRQQLADLEATMNAVPADLILSATPLDLGGLVSLNKPLVQVLYGLEERDEPRLSTLVLAFLREHGLMRGDR